MSFNSRCAACETGTLNEHSTSNVLQQLSGEGLLQITQFLFYFTMQLYNSFPPVDDAIAKLKEIDYVKLGHNTINVVITVYAVVYAVLTYVWTALQLWWDDNGEDVKVNAVKLTFNTIDFVADVIFALRDLFRWVKVMSNRLPDSAYFNYIFS